jgi:hypothetical protein
LEIQGDSRKPTWLDEYFQKLKEAELAINMAFKIRHKMWWYNACELPSSDIPALELRSVYEDTNHKIV